MEKLNAIYPDKARSSICSNKVQTFHVRSRPPKKKKVTTSQKKFNFKPHKNPLGGGKVAPCCFKLKKPHRLNKFK